MIRLGAALLALTLSLAPSRAAAVLLIFDDIPAAVGGSPQGTIPDGYGGLVWSSAGFIRGSTQHPGSGFENGAVSGSYVAYNEFAAVTVVNGGLFRFQSAYFTAAWNNDLELDVEGYQGGSLLFTLPSPLIVDPTAPTFRAFNWAGIDELRISASGGTNAGLGGSGAFFAMDDFSFDVVIPEPSTGLLAAAGVMLLVLRRLLDRS